MAEFITLNVSNKEAINIIKKKIKDLTPFAFTRFGDGEIKLLNRSGSDNFNKKHCNLHNYKWPEEVESLMEKSIKVLEESIIKSDMIGLLDPNCKIITLPYIENKWSMRKNYIRSLKIEPENLKICDYLLTRGRNFGDIKQFNKILQGRSLNIISCNVEKMKENKIQDLIDAPVAYTYYGEVTHEGTDLFLKQLDIKEDVVIFGAGVCGKNFGVYLKENHGKVCIDFGATLDGWAGIISRGWFRPGGLQEYCLYQK